MNVSSQVPEGEGTRPMPTPPRTDGLYTEYVVMTDADPGPIQMYRGPDEKHAWELFNDFKVTHPGWGITLQSRTVGPTVILGVKR